MPGGTRVVAPRGGTSDLRFNGGEDGAIWIWRKGVVSRGHDLCQVPGMGAR